ncbi:HD domain-containing protein [Selenomonas caprae]|uniref:bis(5'-nucleosyl)-tetraphosphatase (symmetrical) n=1 Tax=Selenomonas caprae TaxID=2606905 RepID=A0A5D6WKI7_9FIRM|nr:bis(5'-nucleosyl)-tetraphosphatase (symmetrical) YqeK [Selenomonas caprae]TYZ28357.1 HD domain-containing protein [Selenomonas caprae]
MSYEAMEAELASRLKDSRFRHCLGVAETAVFLAHRFGADEERARVAGLLHDCAREYRNEDMLAEAQRRGIAIGEVERAMPLLLHAYIGARRVREIYHVDDAMVEQAIWRHTVGGTGMTDLDKIIWFADMVEPGRNYPGVEELRRLAKTASLDDMVLEGLSQSIRFVVAKGHLIHPDTVLARNELLLKKTGRNEP